MQNHPKFNNPDNLSNARISQQNRIKIVRVYLINNDRLHTDGIVAAARAVSSDLMPVGRDARRIHLAAREA